MGECDKRFSSCRRKTPAFVILVVFLFSCICVSFVQCSHVADSFPSDRYAQGSSFVRWLTFIYSPSPFPSSLFLVPGQDGSIYAINALTGDNLWMFSTPGGPLLKSSTPKDPEYDGVVADGDDIILAETQKPSSPLDSLSSLYFLKDSSALSVSNTLNESICLTNIQKQRLGASELVENTPFVSSDGTLFLGHKSSNLYVLDPMTGVLKHSNLEAARSGTSLHKLSPPLIFPQTGHQQMLRRMRSAKQPSMLFVQIIL